MEELLTGYSDNRYVAARNINIITLYKFDGKDQGPIWDTVEANPTYQLQPFKFKWLDLLINPTLNVSYSADYQ